MKRAVNTLTMTLVMWTAAGCAGAGYPLNTPEPNEVVLPRRGIEPVETMVDLRRHKTESIARGQAGHPVEITTGPLVRFVNWNDHLDPDGLDLLVQALDPTGATVRLPRGHLLLTLYRDTAGNDSRPGYDSPLERRGEPVLQWRLGHDQLNRMHRHTLLMGHHWPMKLAIGGATLWRRRDGVRVAAHYVLETRFVGADGLVLVHLDPAIPYTPYPLDVSGDE